MIVRACFSSYAVFFFSNIDVALVQLVQERACKVRTIHAPSCRDIAKFINRNDLVSRLKIVGRMCCEEDGR